MSWTKISTTVVLITFLQCVVANQNSFQSPSPTASTKQSSLLTELILKNECFTNYNTLKQISICLKAKLLVNLNELIRSNKTIELGSYAYLVKTKTVDEVDNRIDDERLNEIPNDERSATDEGEQLTNMILKKVWQLFMTRSVRLNLNDESGLDGEGRKKKDKGGNMMMMAMGMGGMMMQMMMSKVAIIAVKALIIGKIALLLSGMIALKKMMSQGGGHGGSSHGSTSDWSSRRMYIDDSAASDMAFRAYTPTLTVKK
ncbi:hypothetical protein WDU94_001986 [Cyamophila willieti]